MNVKKAIKRIAALAAGTTMVTATIMGASADLGDFPSPFVENGVFNGKLVIGQSGVAQVSDVLGAIDIAASLQAASKTPISVSGSSSTVSVTGGVGIKSGSDDLNFGDELDDFNQGQYDNDDFPDLLADGTLEDDDGTDYDYEQFINVGSAAVAFAQDDDYSDDPIFHLDLGAAGNKTLNFSVEFDDAVNVTELEDSESMVIFGKEYTFDPNHDLDDDLTLYGSDVVATVSQDEPVTVEVSGEEYTLEVLGGNSDDSTAIIRVTGSSTSTKTLTSGESRTMAGLDLFIDDVFISNIGANTISVSVFVGSNKIVIPSTAVSATLSYDEIEINDEDQTDIFAWVDTGTEGNLGDVDAIRFYVDPTDFNNPATDEDWDWLIEGAEWTEPLFGFTMSFDSFTPVVDGRNMVEFTRSGDTYAIGFTNNDGDEYALDLYQSPAGATALGDDLVLTGDTLLDGEIFILEETSANPEDTVTKIFEVRDIDGTNTEITLRDLGTGASKVYDLAEQIGDTDWTISAIDAGDADFTLDMNVSHWIVFEGGANISLDYTHANTTLADLADGANLTFYEDPDDLDDVANARTLSWGIRDGTAMGDSDEDIVMSNAAWSAGGAVVADTDSDIRYGISDYGTWFEQEVDQSGAYLDIYLSEIETDFHVFLNGPDAVVVTSGGSSDSTAYSINDFVVGQIAVYDNEAMSLLGSTPLIVIGGPCVNTVAMSLMGNPEVCAEGFAPGKGKIKFYSAQNALLVAGYAGDDTIGAAYVLADYMNPEYALTGDEVEVIVTDLSNLQVQSVA